MRLSGKFLAGSDGPFLRQKAADLIDAGTRKLIFDFEEVPYIDSTGLGFLARSQELARTTGATIVLANLNEHVKKVIDSVQLTKFFIIAANQADAIEQLKGAAPPTDVQPPAPTKGGKGRKRAAPPDPQGEKGA